MGFTRRVPTLSFLLSVARQFRLAPCGMMRGRLSFLVLLVCVVLGHSCDIPGIAVCAAKIGPTVAVSEQCAAVEDYISCVKTALSGCDVIIAAAQDAIMNKAAEAVRAQCGDQSMNGKCASYPCPSGYKPRSNDDTKTCTKP